MGIVEVKLSGRTFFRVSPWSCGSFASPRGRRTKPRMFAGLVTRRREAEMRPISITASVWERGKARHPALDRDTRP
jgi:hypothetical protein